LNRKERGRFLEASAAIDELPLRIDDSSIVTVPAMHAAVRRYNASNPKLRLVVVDYLQLMEATGRQENRVLELSQITRGLKRMAMELDVAILAACQLNRAAADDRPQLHNLRESGSIEQDADTVMFLWLEGHIPVVSLQKWIRGRSPIDTSHFPSYNGRSSISACPRRCWQGCSALGRRICRLSKQPGAATSFTATSLDQRVWEDYHAPSIENEGPTQRLICDRLPQP
jgi:hypothetical protein